MRQGALEKRSIEAVLISVNEEACSGCGACVEACPAGAIQLLAGRPVIASSGCTGCLSCVQACPQGALTAVELPEVVTIMSLAKSGPAGGNTVPRSGTSPWVDLAAKAMAAFARELAPRLAEAFLRNLNRRRSGPAPIERAIPVADGSASRFGPGARRQRRQHRRRLSVSAVQSMSYRPEL